MADEAADKLAETGIEEEEVIEEEVIEEEVIEEEVIEEEVIEEEVVEEEIVEEEIVEEEVEEEIVEESASSVPSRRKGDDDDDDLNKHEWSKPGWTKDAGLKNTGTGEAVKKGSNLAAPVTHVNKDKDGSRDVNKVANASLLRSTETGNAAKAGANLAAPVTNIRDVVDDDDDDEDAAKLAWEKPSWAKQNVLKSTDKGNAAKQGENLASEVTHIQESENKIGWEKPSWATSGPKLKSTGKADAMKAGNLAKEITHINANKDASRDVNDTANTDILKNKSEAGGKDISWEKPAWTQNAGLKSTEKGEKLKEKGNLERPITFPKGK